MSGRGPALCPVCRRQMPMRQDGRLRAHLAVRGQRGQCEGSGQLSARVTLLGAGGARLEIDTDTAGWDHMTPAQRFNAREEWAKVYALLDELNDMTEVGAASYAARCAATQAFNRALRDAKALAPFGVMRGIWGDGGSA